MENAKWQSEALDERPSHETVEIKLHRVSEDFLGFKCVDEPHGDVADKEEGDGLASGLAAFLFRQVDTATRNISDEE